MKKIKIPQVIGHRGAAGYAPENTLEAIHTAADMGIKWVELDVKLTKDGVPIIFHDEDLDRTTNGSGPVAEKTYEEIRQLEAGYHFADSFSGVKIPTLEEAIEVIIERDLGLNLEIKPCPGREVETAKIALDILSQYWDDHQNLLISSFSEVALATAHDLASDWARGLCLEGDSLPENWDKIAQYLEVSTVNIDGNTMSERDVKDIIEHGYTALAYTINDPTQAHMLQSWGVSGFFSDEPDVIADAVLSLH